MKTKHILSARQFEQDEILDIFATADEMAKLSSQGFSDVLANCPRGMVSLFYKESTRTRFSFENALHLLGGKLLNSTLDPRFSSEATKGENFDDTIEIFASSPGVGVIVLRHGEEGMADRAAEIAGHYGVSVINGGDGANEHPTQALLDLYTIWKRRNGRLDEVKIAVCNDIRDSRTIRSLCLMLVKNFRVHLITTCAPIGVSLPTHLGNELIGYGANIWPVSSLKEAANEVEFLYMTRPQKEHYTDPNRLALFQDFRITKALLDSLPASNPCVVMHPMPIDSKIFNEIEREAKHHPRCIIFEQARNGHFIRMALLKMLLCPS